MKISKVKESLLPYELLITLLRYEHETGLFYWLVDRSTSCKADKIAGGLNNKGYVVIEINNQAYPAHRLAWLYVYSKYPVGVIDHINGVPSDNRIINIRDVPHRTNMENKSKYVREDSTLPTGVYAEKRKDGSASSYYSVWRDVNRKLCSSPYFNVKKHGGDSAAIEAAKNYRDNMLSELNKVSANYTERHGK